MNLLDYTIQSGFLPQLKCESLTDAVARLVATLPAAGEATASAELVAEVMRRENEGSTAVGGGLVIPHARFHQVSTVRIAVATLARPLDLAAADGQAVDIVILLVGPTGDPRLMLRVLARLARLVRQDSFLAGLREAQDGDSLRRAFALAEDSGA
jgi:mannitol/fructose-specific phosphotransferase system IIA component (Ntr-type)